MHLGVNVGLTLLSLKILLPVILQLVVADGLSLAISPSETHELASLILQRGRLIVGIDERATPWLLTLLTYTVSGQVLTLCYNMLHGILLDWRRRHCLTD